VFNWAQSFNSGKKTGQAAVRDLYRNIPEEFFYEDIRKLPRRWELFVTKRVI
jgi:hypothetical protein